MLNSSDADECLSNKVVGLQVDKTLKREFCMTLEHGTHM
jgi:hypothetical protein